mmetsp:Transcript_49241/g.130411  ORF Transcript_49241/g.130411 Transcript_49241/m.130411 type:complete len:87 (+) Transcript_49241:226-486(+)
MDKLAQDERYAGKVVFLMINTKSTADAETYKNQRGLSDSLLHGAVRPPSEYGLRYIPHKTLINREGVVIKNFDGINLSRDIDALLS